MITATITASPDFAKRIESAWTQKTMRGCDRSAIRHDGTVILCVYLHDEERPILDGILASLSCPIVTTET